MSRYYAWYLQFQNKKGKIIQIKGGTHKCNAAMLCFQMKTRQDYIVRILESRKIIFEQIDISDQSQESEKAFMRKHSVAKEGQKVPLPPQIFFDDQYCGVCTML